MNAKAIPAGPLQAVARLLGERLRLRDWSEGEVLCPSPLVVRWHGGVVVLFRYGVVVGFGLDEAAWSALEVRLADRVVQPFPRPVEERVDVRVEAEAWEGPVGEVVVLRAFDVPRLSVLADILAKSVVLEHYEETVSAAFDAVEPLAERLERSGGPGRGTRDLVRHIGRTLRIRHKMVGRVEVAEKPEVLWEHPELERLYARLEDEYELRERHLALERKLDLIADTAETLLELLQAGRSLRVEWYIVVLIVVEIGLTLYELFVRH